MPKARKFFESMTEELFFFNVLLIPFAFVLGVMTQDIYAPLAMLLFIPVLIYHYILRAASPGLFIFLILTWIICPLGLITGHRVLHTLFLALLCSRSVRRRTNGASKLKITFEVLCFPLIFLATLYIAADYLAVPKMRDFFYGQAIAVFLLALIYIHLSGINNELELSSSDTLQSTKVITKFATKYLMVYLVCFFLMLALFRYMPFGKLAAMLVSVMSWFARLLLSLLPKHGGEISGNLLKGYSEEPVPYTLEPAPAWVTFIEKILIYSVNLIVLGIFILFIVIFFLRLYYGFHASKEGRLVFGGDEVSRVTALTPQKKKLFGRHIEDPIRRKFFKKLNKHYKRGRFTRADSPDEIAKKLDGKEDLGELNILYKQARYYK